MAKAPHDKTAGLRHPESCRFCSRWCLVAEGAIEQLKAAQRFFDIYWRLIYGVALRAGLTDAEAQDVVQETVISVAKHLPGFRYDPKVCSFKTWKGVRWGLRAPLRV